jgi:hypothetical protein
MFRFSARKKIDLRSAYFWVVTPYSLERFVPNYVHILFIVPAVITSNPTIDLGSFEVLLTLHWKCWDSTLKQISTAFI